jgi:hypothetical protein
MIFAMKMNRILKNIQNKLSKDHFLTEIAQKLSGTEFNSLLLEIFNIRAATIKPAQLLKEFEHNRFVEPAKIDTIKSRELELKWLKHADKKGFRAIILSPVSPLGTCSAMGKVNQNKIISSLRGTEVVADATNVLAMKIARDFKRVPDKNLLAKYSTVHRHIRSQFFNNPDFSAHFDLFCMVSGGFDRGSYIFELQQLNEHIGTILDLLKISFPQAKTYLQFYLKEENNTLKNILTESHHAWNAIKYDFLTDLENKYYQTIQFKIFISLNEREINIADGGIVNWIQQLTGNKKHRTMISGVGIELMLKLLDQN